MLLGEDTGYMDITQSHTITIDKDDEIQEEANTDFSVHMAQTIRGDLNVASQKGLPLEAKAERKNAANDSDFSAFLASVSLPTVNTIKPHYSENNFGNIFSSANTSTSDIDKENHLPSFLVKQHSVAKGNPQQPRRLQRRRSRVGIVEDADIEATTVVTENKDNAQPFTPSVSVNQRGVAFMTPAFSNISDDMELTLNQTAAINVKVTGNIICNVQAALEHNRSHHFSESDDAMEMTRAFDVSAREKDHTMSMKEQAQPSVPTVRRMSSFNMIENGETTDTNKAGYLQSNLSIAQTTNSDDMEMTGTFDVSVREKDHTMSTKEPAHPPITKESNMSTFGNGETVDRNKSSNNFIAQTANPDYVGMAKCQTIVLNEKQSSGNKPFSNTRKSLPLVPLSRSVREDEHTGNMKEEALHPVPRVSKMPCFDLDGDGVIMNHKKSGHLPIALTANSDEMEMTQCQTIFLEAKQVNGDKPLNNSRKNWPHTSLSGPEGSDGMDMTQAFTGRIMLNAFPASKKKRGESILMPATTTSAPHNDSDCIDLTCQPSTFDRISTPRPDEMELTRCTTINIDSNRTWLGSAVDITDARRASFSANQTITVVEPMEMTEVPMAPVSEQKYEAFMSQRKSGARMMPLMCDPENTEADNHQIDFSNLDDMDMTQCQTVVLEAENVKRAKPFSKSRRSLNLVSTSSSPDVDSMEITQTLTGNIVLKSFVSNEESKHERNLLPVVQICQTQDESDCMEMTSQESASNLAIPCVDDKMELTGCSMIAIDSKSTLAASASEIKVQSALWASTSVSRCTVSSEEQNEVSEPVKCVINHVFPSKHVFDLDGKNIKSNNTEIISYGPADMQVDKKYEMAHPSNVMTTDEDSDMQVTKVLTMPIETQQSVSFNEKEAAPIKTFCGSRNEEGRALWPNKEQSTSSVQLEGSSSNESVVDSFIIEELQQAKARRRSLADFQMELHNMSRRIQDEQKAITGSTTAPLPCSLTENSLKEQCEMEISNVTPKVEKINNYVQNEKTTPFSLKKAFSSRLSLCGIVPKLPKRATTVTPNKTVTISTNDLQCLQLEKLFDVAEQNSNCKAVNINDEEFPEMSSEEDMSGSLENWPIKKQDELDSLLVVSKYEELLENEVFESETSMSPCFKRLHPEEEPITAERTKKVCVSDMVGSKC